MHIVFGIICSLFAAEENYIYHFECKIIFSPITATDIARFYSTINYSLLIINCKAISFPYARSRRSFVCFHSTHHLSSILHELFLQPQVERFYPLF